ncbi:MAG: hypothetical protein ACFB9M_02305 [Myxococcota bacterium]
MPSLTRETTIRRTADGVWFHDGVAVEHPGVRRAFDCWVDIAEDGRTILKNDANWAYVQIDGAPVFVMHARVEGEHVELSLSDGRLERLDPASLREDEEGMLYCSVRGGRLAARFTRNALVELGDVLKESEGRVVLELGNDRIRWPRVEAPLDDPRGKATPGPASSQP